MAAKRSRWNCPTGKHAGVLGPMRPRKDDIVRYCLPCSSAKGRLVERVSPAVTKATAAKKAATEARAARKAEATKRRTARYYNVNGIDALEYARRMATLPAFSAVKARALKVVMHRVSYTHNLMGMAHGAHWNGVGTIELYVKPKWDEARLRSTVLHELAHLQVHAKRYLNAKPHGKEFNRILARAIDQATKRFGAPAGIETFVSHSVGEKTAVRRKYESLGASIPA